MEGSGSHPISTPNSFTPHSSSSPLKILYFNARSILPKLDELFVLAETHNPDIICIVESWLNVDIVDAEVAIPGYVSCRADRDRNGGGIIIYIKSSFQFSLLPNPPSGLELLTIILQHSTMPARICLSVFYRPPSSGPEILDNVCDYFDSIDTAKFTNFIILGDFNIDVSTHSHPLSAKLNVIMSTYNLSQMVTEYTHTHHNGTRSMIDLVFVSDPQLVRCCTIIPPIQNSDHSGLKINLSLRSTSAATKRRVVWRYKHADWDKACGLIDSTD